MISNQQPRPEGTGYVVLNRYLYSGLNTLYKRPKGRGIKPLNTNHKFVLVLVTRSIKALRHRKTLAEVFFKKTRKVGAAGYRKISSPCNELYWQRDAGGVRKTQGSPPEQTSEKKQRNWLRQ